MRIPQSVINAARAASDDAMPDTGTILRRTLTDDGEGGKTQSYAEAGTSIYRLTRSRLDRDDTQGGRPGQQQEWQLSVPVGTDIAETDRFRTAAGEVFEVLATVDMGSYAIRRRMTVKKI